MSFELRRKEISYRFRMANGQRLVATVAWPDPVAVRKAYDRMGELRMKQVEADKIEFQRRSNEHFTPFLVDHLLALKKADGSDLKQTIEEQKQLLREKPHLGLATALVRDSLFNCELVAADLASQDSDLTLMFSDSIGTIIREYDVSQQETIEHHLTHFLNEPTVLQRSQYEDATKTLRDTRHNRMETRSDIITITRLYSERVRAIEGAAVDGEPCDEANKQDWVSLIPYSWIAPVMAEDSRGAQAENFT